MPGPPVPPRGPQPSTGPPEAGPDRRFRDMPVPPHDNAVAGQSAAPLQVHFGDLAGRYADPEAVVTLAERGAHRAAPCRPSALSSPLATLAPPRPLLNQSSGRNRRPAEDRTDHVTPSYRLAQSVRAACAACVTDYQADNSHSTDIMRLGVITVRYHFLRPKLSCRSPDAVMCTQSLWLYMDPTVGVSRSAG